MPLTGIKVLDLTRVVSGPFCTMMLADFGADVIKIEHPVRGDSQRGFVNMGGVKVNPKRSPFVEHPNRGKRSVGVDITKPEGMAVIYELAKTADVFLTNHLPGRRQKLKFDTEHIRAVNPNIIYARGSAYGDKGPERDVGGFDGTAFWNRSGIATAMSPEELGGPISQGIPAFGDSIGGMNIAGGISAALFHRERTGEALELDVSLLSSAWWAAGTSIDMGIDCGQVSRNRMPTSGGNPGNPFMGNYATSDGGTINLCTLTPGPHIRNVFEHLGLPDAADDPRFATAEALMQNWQEASDLIRDKFAAKPFDYWRAHLKTMSGQWAPVLDLLTIAEDEQALANDMLFEVEAGDGGEPVKLVRGPVQFNHEPTRTTRAPEASEHTELVLMEMGMGWDMIEQLKEKGAIA